MINIWLALRNPRSCRPFAMIWNREGRITANKSWELQFSRYAYNWLEFKLDLAWWGQDHAGPWLTINVFGWTLDARVYDRRHWNDDANDWHT